jgi:hypothetical protein
MTASEFSFTGTRATTQVASEPTMLEAVCWVLAATALDFADLPNKL